MSATKCPQVFLVSKHVNVGQAERAASLMLGTLAVIGGLFYLNSWLGFLAIIFGGGLIYRGASGHCLGYSLFGYSTANRGSSTMKSYETAMKEDVDESSEESFPASDPPAWTSTTVSRSNRS